MSHSTERKEKDCLNCGAEVQGRFCHICGQENTEPKESFWHLLTHFVYDITHFDGKFFSTLRYLLFRPGFLSIEYLKGRRASYLHPIRMYVFTSAFFFLVLFSTHKEEEAVKVTGTPKTAARVIQQLEARKAGLQADLKDSLPGMARKQIETGIRLIDEDIAAVQKDSTAKDRLQSAVTDNFTLFDFSGENRSFSTLAAYDAAQAALPVAQRASFIQRKFEKQNLYLKQKYHNNSKEIWMAILAKFRHLMPQMLFVSLPFFALILQLLYVRKKQWYYVNQVVYTIHLYCATFIIILLGMLADLAAVTVGGKQLQDWAGFLFTLAGFYYWYRAMRNFYGQGRGRTLLKYLLVLLLSLMLMCVIFVLFFIFSAMAI